MNREQIELKNGHIIKLKNGHIIKLHPNGTAKFEGTNGKVIELNWIDPPEVLLEQKVARRRSSAAALFVAGVVMLPLGLAIAWAWW